MPQSLEISARPEAPVVSGDYAVSTTEDGKFVYTIETVENAEYKMDDGQWQDSNVFDNIEPLSNHMFYVRVKATNNSFAGTEGKSAIIFEKLTGSASVSMEDWISNETASEPNPVSETNGTDNVTYFYKLSSADDSDYSSVRPTKPGTYTIKAVFGETATYGEVVVTSEFTINEADEKQDVTDKNKKVEDEEKQVDTGDATNMLMWFVLVFLSGSAFALAFVFRKRKA